MKTLLTIQDAVKLSFLTMKMKMEKKLFNLSYIVSPPGAGKTSIIGYLADKHNYGFLPYSPALERIEKFGGIPDIIKEGRSTGENILKTVWSVPQMVCEINDLAKKKEAVVVLFDDWHLCDEDLQSIGFELFTYFKINNHPLADNIVFILAGNDSSAAGAEMSLSAIRNRCTMFNTKPDLKYWLEEFAIPNNLNPVGISFFQNKAMNERYFHTEESTTEQFGSPRSWTSAFNYISELEKLDKEPNLKLIKAVLEGSVSQEGAGAFMNYYSIYREIDLNEIFEKGNINIPKDIVNKYAYSMAVTNESYNRFFNGNEEDTKKIYSKFLSELSSDMFELAVSSLIYLIRLPAPLNEERSGHSVVTNLVKENYIDKSLLKKMVESNSVMS